MEEFLRTFDFGEYRSKSPVTLWDENGKLEILSVDSLQISPLHNNDMLDDIVQFDSHVVITSQGQLFLIGERKQDNVIVRLQGYQVTSCFSHTNEVDVQSFIAKAVLAFNHVDEDEIDQQVGENLGSDILTVEVNFHLVQLNDESLRFVTYFYLRDYPQLYFYNVQNLKVRANLRKSVNYGQSREKDSFECLCLDNLGRVSSLQISNLIPSVFYADNFNIVVENISDDNGLEPIVFLDPSGSFMVGQSGLLYYLSDQKSSGWFDEEKLSQFPVKSIKLFQRTVSLYCLNTIFDVKKYITLENSLISRERDGIKIDIDDTVHVAAILSHRFWKSGEINNDSDILALIHSETTTIIQIDNFTMSENWKVKDMKRLNLNTLIIIVNTGSIYLLQIDFSNSKSPIGKMTQVYQRINHETLYSFESPHITRKMTYSAR